MIISPPFLPARNANESEDAYLNRAMTAATHGRYPVSNMLGWHGGIHLTAPSGNNNTRLPVRAIADGTVAYIRQPTVMPADTNGHPLGYNGWTDDGCVVIRHNNAIGAEGNTETTVRFFSIYLHLNNILPAIRQGEVIRRKAEIGRAGMFEGEAGVIHFEIVCDDENLAHLVGRNKGDIDTNTDGRTDAVFGDIHFKLPANTQVYPQRPGLNQIAGTDGTALGEELFAGIRYDRGNAQVTTYRRNATTLGNALIESGAEYNLYRDAGRIVTAYRSANTAIVPAHSAVYELLRFGRVLGPEALNPSDTPHWRQIRTAAGQGWVNLNAPDVTKYSDADAPHWTKWFLLQDYQDGDGRCSLDVIRNLLDVNDDGVTTLTEAQIRIGQDPTQQLMRGVVAKFPTEWHRGSIATRWNWLTEEGPNGTTGATYLTQDDFTDFQRHAEALCFWENANLGIDPAHWHFHPRRFIEHFRKCGWLSISEMRKIYEDRESIYTDVAQSSDNVKERYRISFNRVFRKYLLNIPLRMAHFFGQAAQESYCFMLVRESSSASLPRSETTIYRSSAKKPVISKSQIKTGHNCAISPNLGRWATMKGEPA